MQEEIFSLLLLEQNFKQHIVTELVLIVSLKQKCFLGVGDLLMECAIFFSPLLFKRSLNA